MLQGLVDVLVDEVEIQLRSGNIVDMVHAYSALTQDIIMDYCFADCKSILLMEDFAPHFYHYLHESCVITPVLKQMPWLISLLDPFPDWFVRRTHKPTMYVREQLTNYKAAVVSVFQDDQNQEKKSHKTIFHALRDCPELPDSEKSIPRLTVEAMSIVGAGTLTSAHILSPTTYHVLVNPQVLETLMQELEHAIPDPSRLYDTGLKALAQLPYLTAVIQEGLRVGYGTAHRVSRVHPDYPLYFKSWVIPPSTPVGMSANLLHEDEDMFPNARAFDPGRWLRAERTEAMARRLFNFGMGARQCVGINPARAELYLALAGFFRILGRRVRDVDYTHDYFLSFPGRQSKGVRIVAKLCP